MYKIEILNSCENDEIYAAIMSAVISMTGNKEADLYISPLKRSKLLTPAWNSLARNERFENKF